MRFRAKCGGLEVKEAPVFLTDEQMYRRIEAMAKVTGGA